MTDPQGMAKLNPKGHGWRDSKRSKYINYGPHRNDF